MDRDQKAAVIEEIAAQIKDAGAVFAVDYRGISVTDAADLRVRLHDADATFRVVKNSLTERAADKAGAEALKELLEGPTAFTFVRGDAAVAAKALADFARVSDTLAFKGGLLDGEVVTVEQITSISRLPARDVLHAQLVGTVAAPITGLVRGLGSMISGLARQLQQMADQGLVTGEAPPVEEAPPEEAPAEEAPPEEAPAEEAPAEAAEAPAEEAPAEAEGSADEETPTPAEEQSSPADDAPAEAAPDEPPAEEPAAEEPIAQPEPKPDEGEDAGAGDQDSNDNQADAPADGDDTAEAAKED